MEPHPGHTSGKLRPQLQTQLPPHPAQLGHAPASLGSPLWSTKQLWAHSPGGLHAAFICSRPASHSPTTWPTHSGGLPGPRDGPADPNRSPSSRVYTTEASLGGCLTIPRPRPWLPERCPLRALTRARTSRCMEGIRLASSRSGVRSAGSRGSYSGPLGTRLNRHRASHQNHNRWAGAGGS